LLVLERSQVQDRRAGIRDSRLARSDGEFLRPPKACVPKKTGTMAASGVKLIPRMKAATTKSQPMTLNVLAFEGLDSGSPSLG
jgi:hypothetical protein